MDILGVLTAELGVKMSQVEAAVKGSLDGGKHDSVYCQIPEGSNPVP